MKYISCLVMHKHQQKSSIEPFACQDIVKQSSFFISKCLLAFAFVLFAHTLSAQFIEDFETGLPASAPAVKGSEVLSSGAWQIYRCYGKTDNGSVRAAMNTDGYLITPLINKPQTLSFNHRGSGSGKELTVSKSIDQGDTWTTIGTAVVNSASSYGASNMQIGEPGTQNVLLRFMCESSTIYLDNITITISGMGDEPGGIGTVHASDVSGSSMKIHLTRGTGEGRLLVYSKGKPVDWLPQDGTDYWSLPKELDDGLFALAGGSEDSALIQGLEAGETYYFAVFEYNGTGENTNYLTSEYARLTQKTLEVASIRLNPASINFGLVKTGTSSKRSFNISAKYLASEKGQIVVSSSSDFLISMTPGDGFSSSLNLPFSDSTLTDTTIYIAFSPQVLQSYAADLRFSGGGASNMLGCLGIGSNTDSKLYYIAPIGNDHGAGTFDDPWYNLQKAVDEAHAGDTIICRGGTYFPSMKKDGSKTTVRLIASGTAQKKITIKNYPSEFPVFNFKDQPKKVSVRGIQLNGDYWHLLGLHITQAGDNGIKLEGNHNVVERCTFSYNDDTGLQLGFGHQFSDTHPGISSNDGTFCAFNDVVDCDSYLNCDADNFGSDADGFACKMHNGKGNRFIRCRAWDNADDAWDLYETDYAVVLIECWAWGSGRAELFTWVDNAGSFQGNGNGIKMGGNGSGGSSEGKHEAWNCVAFNCDKTGSVKGFDQNSHGDGVKLVNCLAFGNGYDFMFEKSSNDCEYYNNVCFGKIEIAGGLNSHNAMLSQTDDAWSNVIRGFSPADYISLSESDAKAPRGSDGSLPGKFARLKSGSILIDKGKLLGVPFKSDFPWLQQPIYGSARDLGPYELEEGEINSSPQIIMHLTTGFDLSVRPNPASNQALAIFSTSVAGHSNLTICNLKGQIVTHVFDGYVEPGRAYTVPVSVGELGNGVYLCQLIIGTQRITRKIIVLK